jgi:tetratricopeptide (TPR) repeat protein
MRLAVAMACYPRTAKQAEREFLEAIRLDPNNADIHYQFGIYYKAMRVRSRAVAELRTALSLSPRHKQARADLAEAVAPGGVLDRRRHRVFHSALGFFRFCSHRSSCGDTWLMSQGCHDCEP